MPQHNLTDQVEEQASASAQQKVAHASVDIASAVASHASLQHRSYHFGQINVQSKEFAPYFEEGERRQVYGEVAFNFQQGNPDAPINGFTSNDNPQQTLIRSDGSTVEQDKEPKPEIPEELYKRYDENYEKYKKDLDKIEEKKQKNRQLLHKADSREAEQFRNLPRKKSRLLTYSKEEGRLVHKDKGRLTERQYYKRLHHADVKDRHRDRRQYKAEERTKRLFNDENIAEDETAGEVGRRLKTARRAGKAVLRHNAKTLRHHHNAYTRLQHSHAQVEARKAREYQLNRYKSKKEDRVLIRSADSTKMKQKLKKEITMRRAREQGNMSMRIKTAMFNKAKIRKARRLTFKRNISLITSIGSSVMIVFVAVALMFMVLFCFVNLVVNVGVRTTTSNTYTDISDATSQFRKMETDMEEFLNPEELEPLLQQENLDKEIYEYIYDLDEFGFSANTLIAYLSVKYQEFDLAEVAGEIETIFDEMYYFHYELIQEPRYLKVGEHFDEETGEMVDDYDWVDVWICYIFLEKTEMETVVENKMTGEELEQYQAYKLSTGGQQVYGGVMVENWTNLISSPYGERIHPITGERTFHNGVDIAIPTGTSLYTPVEGVVTTAAYSDTAGNYLIITTEDGWSVKLMHMDSLAVSAGDTLERGTFVGYSGNTGRSTGPHLHLEVRNPEDVPIDPIFIVPQAVSVENY